MKFIITTGDCDHEGRPPRPSGKTIEIIFGNVWRGPRGDIADAEREAWDAKETPEGAQAKADAAQQAATAAAAEALKAHADDAEIHKTSKQIRADIVEEDIPAIIARKTDVATTLAEAKEYTDDSVARKADTAAMTEALAGKVDVVAGTGLMSDEEREKLSGIETGANAYTLPVATASSLGGVKAGDNVTIADDGTLSATAAPYELPAASSTVLGGVKVGRNLSIDTEGRLSAVGGGSDTGDGVLTLPYVVPERDADGNITNSAAYVDAWGGILAEYLAAPDSHAFYMEIDAGEGLMLRMPCNLMNMGGEADAVQWLISGFGIVNVPMSSSESVSCKATCMANVVCNAAGEMQSLVMYASEGIARADGKPNLLGEDDAIIVAISDNATEEQLKAITQPVVEALQANPKRRVVIQYGFLLIPATTAITDTEFLIAALDANPLTVGDPDSKFVIKVQVYCKLSNGVIESAIGGVTGYELATTQAPGLAAERVSATDRLLSFDANGNPLTATASQVSDYVQGQIPRPTYRNLCLNSRGDNLNGWDRQYSASALSIDDSTFGYPVICLQSPVGLVGLVSTGNGWSDNYSELSSLAYSGGGSGLNRAVTLSYDIYTTHPSLVYTGMNIDYSLPNNGISVSENEWRRLVIRIPQGTLWHQLIIAHIINCVANQKTYIKNIQIEYEAEATSYCHNPTLPSSLTEQLVPGEFWEGKQVYVRTFVGTTPEARVISIMTGIYEAHLVNGYIFNIDNYKIPAGLYNGVGSDFWSYAASPGNLLTIESIGENLQNKPYKFTIKYTKA